MDGIDGTTHYTRTKETTPPSLLVIVLDTNPFAWATLSPGLTLSKSVADILVFINAHLAFNHANRVAVIASHCQKTAWLYPTPTGPSARDVEALTPAQGNKMREQTIAPANSNKYRPFALIEHELRENLRTLLETSKPDDLVTSPTSTMIAGALTLALSYINKTSVNLSSTISQPSANTNTDGMGGPGGVIPGGNKELNSRILIVSTSGDLATQYIPVMNVIFAAQASGVAVDILKLAGDTVLLQQASYTTSGIFITPGFLKSSGGGNDAVEDDPEQSSQRPGKPVELLSTLLFAFLPDSVARAHLIPATGTNIDFRAACFCHRRIVDIGYVCSICLSIFCDEGVAIGIEGQKDMDANTINGTSEVDSPSGVDRVTGACLTCGTQLSLKVLTEGTSRNELSLDERPRKRKKKRRQDESNIL